MRTITVSIFVECPVDEVFAFVTDARNNPLWQSTSGLRESRQLPESPVGVGTQITEIWHIIGVRTHVTSEVTAYEPGRYYTRHLLNGSSPVTQGTHVFVMAESGTHWTSTIVVQAGGAFPAAESALAAQLQQAMETSLTEAKALLEQRAVDTMR